MTEISRRLVLGGAALGGLIASGGVADAYDTTMQPPFGPAPEPLAGKELPSFRFAMGDEKVALYDGGTSKQANVSQFPVSDVGYVPQGFGHYIENIGEEDLEVLLALNNATYESISITEWMSAQTDLLLATNFEVPEATFKDFPTHRLVMPAEKG